MNTMRTTGRLPVLIVLISSTALAILLTPKVLAENKDAMLPPIPREFRAVWVATVDNIDWPSKTGLSTGEQQEEMRRILDRCAAMNINAVIFQVRPTADALYESALEPWSGYLSGEQGQAPQPMYDPLEFVVAEAHQRGIEIHAWFNPYRAQHPANTTVDALHVSKQHPEWVRSYGKYLWMDPGDQDALAHTLAVIGDVVTRYDIDGIHVDDYFYPYPIKDDKGERIQFPDDKSWSFYREHGGLLSRDDWRCHNINELVRRMYEITKAIKPHVKVGFSPFGIWRPHHPEQIVGFDAVDGLYADAKLWLQKGWLDYLTPQLYWATDPPGQSYPVLLKWWVEQNNRARHIWPGNALYRTLSGKRGWTRSELARQIHLTRAQPGATGNVFFSMKTFTRNTEGLADEIGQLYAIPALVPASPWIDDQPPTVPDVKLRRGRRLRLKMGPGDGEPVSHWVIQAQYGLNWDLHILPAGRDQFGLADQRGGVKCDRIAVRSVDRNGNLSAPNLKTIRPKTKTP